MTWICENCHEQLFNVLPEDSRAVESRRCENCHQGRLCYLVDHDSVRSSRFDIAEIVHRMQKMATAMETYHRLDHSSQPGDWLYCSLDPCDSVGDLYRELDESLEVPPTKLPL